MYEQRKIPDQIIDTVKDKSMENKNIQQQDDEIDLMRLFYALRGKIWLIITVGLLFACAAAGFTHFFMTPTYTSESTMLVLSKETTLTSLADLQLGSQLTKDYRILITSRPVLEEVIENLEMEMDYKELKECITVSNPEDTHILSLSVTQPDAKMAKAVVDELAQVSSAYIGDKMEVTPPKIIEDGELPIYKSSPSMKKNVMLGLLAGMVLVCAIVVVLELLNDSIKNEDDIERYLGIPTLAVVPDKGLQRGKKRSGKKKKQGRA